MDTRLRRGGLVGVLAACALMVGLPAHALAGQDTIYSGTLGPGDDWGPRHSLTSVWVSWYAQDYACANALNSDGSGWAGSSFCAYVNDTNVGHAYCGCVLRLGYAYVGKVFTVYATGYWRQFW